MRQRFPLRRPTHTEKRGADGKGIPGVRLVIVGWPSRHGMEKLGGGMGVVYKAVCPFSTLSDLAGGPP
jgi:hypothetical protein